MDFLQEFIFTNLKRSKYLREFNFTNSQKSNFSQEFIFVVLSKGFGTFLEFVEIKQNIFYDNFILNILKISAVSLKCFGFIVSEHEFGKSKRGKL